MSAPLPLPDTLIKGCTLIKCTAPYFTIFLLSSYCLLYFSYYNHYSGLLHMQVKFPQCDHITALISSLYCLRGCTAGISVSAGRLIRIRATLVRLISRLFPDLYLPSLIHRPLSAALQQLGSAHRLSSLFQAPPTAVHCNFPPLLLIALAFSIRSDNMDVSTSGLARIWFVRVWLIRIWFVRVWLIRIWFVWIWFVRIWFVRIWIYGLRVQIIQFFYLIPI